MASPGAVSSVRSGTSDSSSRTSAGHLFTSARHAYAAVGACGSGYGSIKKIVQG